VAGTKRRTRAEIERLCGLIYEIVERYAPMTVRQVFYQLVSRGAIEKTEREYNNVAVRLLSRMRLDHEIPWSWITDATRWQRKPQTFDNLDAALQQTANFYRRALWRDQDVYVEVWLEKDALAGVLFEVTGEWDVPLMVARGFSSLTYLHGAAEAVENIGKPAYIYYFGDYDPSGTDIEANVERRLYEFAPGANITFERVAVTPDQIETYNLLTRPTKTSTHGRRRHVGESVEVDAFEPDTLRGMVRDVIEQHIDSHKLDVTEAAEESERELLGGLPAMLRRSQAAKAAAAKRERRRSHGRLT
jgi:hypothetical protein